jgi:flavin reductase (DIM6/NTAB) family NADH-FMN oxidoreductase RutF
MKRQIGTFDALQETMEKLDPERGGEGCLLIGGGNGNPMTIGWGNIGIIWSMPIFTVLVRPSRYTFELIGESGEFSVNVLDKRYSKQLLHCGTTSGRDEDKVAACGFHLDKGIKIAIPHLQEASAVYECRTVHKNKVINAALDSNILKRYYAEGDFHTLFFGRILGVYREE